MDAVYILLIASFILLFVATRFFFVGFHNTDLVYNYQNLALQMNPHLQKANLTMVGVDDAMDNMGNKEDLFLSELYTKGVSQKVTGFTLMFFSGVLFTFSILLIELNKNSEDLRTKK